MRQSLQLIFTLAFSWTLVSCQTAQVKTAPEETASASTGQADPSRQAAAPEGGVPELTEDIVFNLLAGEVAAQRGALSEAYDYQLRTARLSGDATAAERATRLALHMDKSELAVEAAALWVELAPEDLTARQLLVVMLLRRNADVPVLEHLKAIVRISENKDENGFLNVMAAINRELKRESAMELMRKLVLEFPGDPRGGYALTIAALVDKDFAAAEREANTLVTDHPDWPKGYLVLSRVFLAQGDKAGARTLLADAVGRFPDDPFLLSAYARLLVDAKELEAAYEQFLRLEKVEQEQGDASYWLGLIALELGRDEVARGHFLRLLEIDGRSDVAAYYLGRIAEQRKESQQALRWYQRVEGGEHRAEAELRIVRLMVATGESREVFEWLQRMRIQYPDQVVRYYLMEVELLREHGTPEQVMALFDTAIGALPDSNELLYARGLYAATQSRVDILERDLLQVIANDPKHADALNALGYTLADQTNRHQEALDYIQRALALKPESAAILDSMGWVMFRLGRYPEALDYLRQAYEKLPDAEIAAHLGEVLWVTGERQQARQVWQEILDKTPESEHVLEVMRRLKI
ncbi:tetratricopeptide repeat protein [Sedimenticola selenatireducens]|uniref:tetratricopeptide repeat protein n=1 Tax=Sedimenticola selenatireducens TaxID=191960 RepID=UPI0004AF2973|nr:tetratricopeptide repeat protein [Sedimenticola selenatireducens]